MTTKFCKFHGFGNDYIVVENDQINRVSDVGEFTRKICHRNTGAGADGIAILEKLDGKEADYSCRIINPDGSEAGFSGNGTRCAVAYLYHKDKWSEKNLTLTTKSGIKSYELLSRNGNTYRFLAELGKPIFAADQIPFTKPVSEPVSGVGSELELEFEYVLPLSDRTIPVTVVNVGNPVCVLFVTDFESNWRKTGAEIETHKQFPERTNVVFVKSTDRENIEIRIWERGAGETSSSGTCSIAAAVASAATERADRKVFVHAPGGIAEVVWRDDDEMVITGSAELAFCGEWDHKQTQ